MYSKAQVALAETFGTAALVLVGPGSVVATKAILGGSKGSFFSGGDLLGISIAFGLVIAFLVYAIGKVSGCHINPAVTFAMACTKRLPWVDVPLYWVAQFVGAVIGALGIWALFAHSAITLGMGATTYNPDTTSMIAAAFAEFIGTGLLLFAILGIVDKRSPGDLAGLIIGGAVIAIIMVVGPVTGASLNPARAFAPQFVLQIGSGVTHWDQYLPVYLVAGFAGAAVASFLYDFLAEPRIVDRPIRAAVTRPDPELSNAVAN